MRIIISAMTNQQLKLIEEVLTREITSGEAEIFWASFDDIDQGADLIMEIHLVMDDGSEWLVEISVLLGLDGRHFVHRQH